MPGLGGYGAALRESRRTEPAYSGTARTGGGARALAHAGAENLVPPVACGAHGVPVCAGWSRWHTQGSGSGLGPVRVPMHATAVARTGGGGNALHDITNVPGSGRAGNGKLAKQPTYFEAAERTLEAAAAPPRAEGGVGVQLSAAAPVFAPAPALAELNGVDLSAVLVEVAEVGPSWSDAEGVQSVSEYAPDIFNLLFRHEANFLPRPNYMELQVDINGKMRAILIDWLVEVHMKYRLRPETLFLTVNLIDRYLTRMPVMRKRLQLVGVVAMFIAAKFEEIDPPKLNDFVYITDNAYTKDDILLMECTFLTTLGFEIAVPTAAHFVDRLLRANRCDAEHEEVVRYILDLSLLDLEMIRHSPSYLVAAALLLSNELLGFSPTWPASMVLHTRHSEQALRGCADELRALLESAPTRSLQAVTKKYMHRQHHSVATRAFATP